MLSESSNRDSFEDSPNERNSIGDVPGSLKNEETGYDSESCDSDTPLDIKFEKYKRKKLKEKV